MFGELHGDSPYVKAGLGAAVEHDSSLHGIQKVGFDNTSFSSEEASFGTNAAASALIIATQLFWNTRDTPAGFTPSSVHTGPSL